MGPLTAWVPLGAWRENERMDKWASELKVVQQLYEFDKEYETDKKVNQNSGFQ